MTATSLPPVEHCIHVPLSPAAAFALFTEKMSLWWPFAGHSCFGDEALDVQFEPRVGGVVTELSQRGERMAWGEITAWSPPDRFAMRWYPGLSAAQATLLQVRFTATADGGCEVSIHHSGWEARGDVAADKRDQYNGGWPATLAALATCARAGARAGARSQAASR